MAKEGFHSVTLSDRTFDILSKVSENLKKAIPETINSLVTGQKVIHGVLFTEEHVCLNCGSILGYNTEKCPLCNSGPIITRYVKSQPQFAGTISEKELVIDGWKGIGFYEKPL